MKNIYNDKAGSSYNGRMPLIRKPEETREEGPIPAVLASLGIRREIEAGTLLFRQGEIAERCFFLERGEVALRRVSRKGAEVEIARIAEGEWFAEAALFAGREFPAQAVAVKDCVALEFGRSAILAFSDPVTASFFLSLLARKCLALNARIDQLTAMEARERVAGFLLGLCPGSRSGCEGSRKPCSFTLPKKKREIASELGMSPETLSRALRRMEDEGYLRIRGPMVEIPSCELLRGIAED